MALCLAVFDETEALVGGRSLGGSWLREAHCALRLSLRQYARPLGHPRLRRAYVGLRGVREVVSLSLASLEFALVRDGAVVSA